MMRIIQEFTENELKQLINDFYHYFTTGFEFEEFLKPFLESLGLTEVVVTKKTCDGGVDLMAVKAGLTEINNVDSVKYRIQAKRNAPSSTISPEKIDALRGNLGFNEKGLFITTAKVSGQAKEKAIAKDPSKPVFVIDGKDLITICIDKQIGFVYRPLFSNIALDEFTNKVPNIANATQNKDNELVYVPKLITANDIRAHIISVPRFIVDKIKNNDQKHQVSLKINGIKNYTVTFCPERNYLGSVTAILKEYKLMQGDGSLVEKKVDWAIDNNQIIHVIINDKG